MATIADLKPEALMELGNRADIDNGVPSRLDKWFKDSYIELGMNVPFETLEESIPDQFSANVDVYNLPQGVRAPKCITMNTTPGSPLLPGNLATVVTLDAKDITYIRQMTSQSPGPPSVYCLFKGQVVIRPIPNDTYSIIWDVWKKPVISPVISTTPLLVPYDWEEIVTMGALMRGFRNLLERDKARELQELLYGFKTDTGKMVPGFITFRQTQQQAAAPFQDWGLGPRKRAYTG